MRAVPVTGLCNLNIQYAAETEYAVLAAGFGTSHQCWT